jgi:type I restriction enzyme R subunit
MANKEAAARIKINKLLEAAGWSFFPEGSAPANIRLEPSVTIKSSDLEALGENFEKTGKGFIDFLLLDTKGFPLIILEAKSEDKSPLVGKEQARKYAKSQNCRFVILSNGNLHYFWDLERGNPYLITSFPTPDSVIGYRQVTPNPQRLIEDQVGDDYIVLTQRPNYASEAAWKNENERPGYELANKLRFLRPYQLKAIHTLQRAVKEGKDRFLFEMATGTGKTLIAAAVIKLFLRSGNARRVLFLVDRLELEDQAMKAFKTLLSADFKTLIYKENRDDWRRAEIVVTTVQSLLFNNIADRGEILSSNAWLLVALRFKRSGFSAIFRDHSVYRPPSHSAKAEGGRKSRKTYACAHAAQTGAVSYFSSRFKIKF